MALEARLGIAPIAWSNDDLPQLGGDTSLETCLSEARLAGFSGVESGGKFPSTAAELRPILDAHDLCLVSGWYSGTVLDADLPAEKARVSGQLGMFKGARRACPGLRRDCRNDPEQARRPDRDAPGAVRRGHASLRPQADRLRGVLRR